jgi:hypothetical protein
MATAQSAQMRDGRPDWAPRFLAAYASSGNVKRSAMAAGIDRDAAYRRRQRDPEFAQAWAQAEQDAVDTLEAEARRRALATSDGMLMFLLKSLRPSVYRERAEVRFDMRREAERIAAKDGLDPDELIAEANKILADSQPQP